MRSLSLALLLLAALLGGLLAVSSAEAETKPAPAPTAALVERVKGNADAPVTIYEFASFTCSHCADFHTKVLPQIEKKFVGTGKAKIIFRDFPLDGVALRASALARCMPDDQYFAFVHVLFAQQARWTADPQPEKALARLGALAGLSPDKAAACMNDTHVLDALAQGRLKATEKFKIAATPTFVLNDGAAVLAGAQPFEKFSAEIEKLLPQNVSKPFTPAPAATPQ